MESGGGSGGDDVEREWDGEAGKREKQCGCGLKWRNGKRND
jgi:hypothetical protein